MKAVRCDGQGGVHVVAVDRPQGDAGDVVVKVASAGICGSDLHLLEGAFPVPATLGHEVAGWLPDGRAVAVEPLAPCGHCDGCTRGDYNLCRLGPSIILGTSRDGGMAEEMLVPERAIVPLPGGVAPRDACLVEPLAVAQHGLRIAGAKGLGKALVVGGGSIGLCATAALVHGGVATALDARHEHQREAGRRLGAQPVDEGGDYDLVVDAAGTKSALERAVALCRPGGTLLLVATYWAGLELPGFALALKEVRVVPASLYSDAGGERDIEHAVRILAGTPELASTLITHRFPLDAAPEAFAAAADRSAGAIKVVLEPGS